MKYFTMEELNDISRELIENPSRETLKKLNDKYNPTLDSSPKEMPTVEKEDNNWVEVKNKVPGITEEKKEEVSANNNWGISMPTPPKVDAPLWQPMGEGGMENPSTVYGEAQIQMPSGLIPEEKKEEVPAPTLENVDIPNLDIQPTSEVESTTPTPTEVPSTTGIPSLELPKEEKPFSYNIVMGKEIPVSGNLWETQNNNLNSMMQTTDNFNAPLDATPNTEVPVSSPFFQGIPAPENTIPVAEPPKMEGPTMFGQLEQNLNNNAA